MGADSVAAWLATGLEREGDACTILGSTLAVKLLSAVRCEDEGTGAYSQRLGRFWLTGKTLAVMCCSMCQHLGMARQRRHNWEKPQTGCRQTG